jgi:uncharacterized protein
VPVADADRAARCARHDAGEPALSVPPGAPRLLVFEKINGFSHGPAVPAARAALQVIDRRRAGRSPSPTTAA